MAAMSRYVGMALVSLLGLSNTFSVLSPGSTMDFLETVCNISARGTVKVGRVMFKSLWRPVIRKASQVVAAISSRPLTDHHYHNLQAFMTIIIEVDFSIRGWQRGVSVVLRHCKGARFKMDGNGVAEISGVADPKTVLKKLGRSRHVKLLWFQFGQCSENLFMASSGKKSDPPAQESRPPIGYGNNTRFPFVPNMHGGFAHGYHPTPHLATPYGHINFDHSDHARPLF